jgi:protein O-GlcNAc transferase
MINKSFLLFFLFIASLACNRSQEDKIPALPENLNSPEQRAIRIEGLKEATQKDPDNHLAFYRLAKLYAEANDLENTYISIKKAIALKPKEVRYLIILTRCFYQKGLYVDAMEQLEKISDKIQPEEYSELAIEIYSHTGNYRKALTLVNEDLKLATADILLFNKKAALTLILKDTATAISLYKKSFAMDSTIVEPIIALSDFYINKNEFDNAKKLAVKAFKLDSTNSKANFNLGLCFKNAGQKDSAIVYYDRAIRYDNSFIKALYNASIIYLQKKQYDKAEQYLRKIILLKSDIPNLEFKLAVTLQSTGKYEEALNYFEMIDTSDINYNFAQKAIKSLKQ